MATADVNNVELGKTEPENNIIYELLTYAEWQQEPEVLNRTSFDKCEDGKTATGIWSWLGSLATSMSGIPPAVQRLRSFHMDWHFAVGGEGKVVAVLQEQSVEISSSRDEYATTIGRGCVPKDPLPQWRRVAWSPDCSFLAVALSTGRLELFDTVGSSLFHIPEPVALMEGVLQDLSYAIAGMVFTEARVHKTQWSYEFITVNYRGQLKSYLLSPSDGYRENHSFNLGSFYHKGVTCLEYHPSHHVLFVAGRAPFLQGDTSNRSSALEHGVTAWRLLSDYPHYKLVTSLADNARRLNARRLLQKMSLYYKQCEETAYRLSICPSGTVMASAHTSGALSFWSLPSLLHIRTWQLEDLPKFNYPNPQIHEPGRRKQLALRPESTQFTVCDINWWSDESLIVAHHSGAVKVVSLSTKRNLLGESPEWFEFSPQVSGVFDRGFLALECEWQLAGHRAAPHATDTGGESSDEETSASVATRVGKVARQALYYVTDNESFAPPRKKPKFVSKFYRLLCVKSTTPEELFVAKIDAEEYGEALALARTYGLDSDLVYQRQWRKSNASVAAIQDYLSKITKRTWVLHECLERVPDCLEAARELLEFGLRGTDVEALVAIGEGSDAGRFIASCPPVHGDIYGREHLTESQLAEQQRIAEQKWRQKELAKVDFGSLTLDQRWLCECRLKLLVYLDRLSIYEEWLGDAPEQFDAAFFERFRGQPPLAAAVGFAQDGDVTAVSSLLTYAGKDILPHWLTILSYFPETLPPQEYNSCLPRAGQSEAEPDVFPWQQKELREKDWCEENVKEAPMAAVWESFNREFYEDNPSLRQWWTESLTSEMLTNWYSERARQIEEISSLIENALEITKLGCQKHVKGLDKLYGNLLTLETLVYECRVTKPVSLSRLEEMSDTEKTRLLMSMSSDEKLVLCLRDWLLPFISRCERTSPGSRRRLLLEFLTEMARENLASCAQVFEHSAPEDPDRILVDALEIAELALACICSCQRDDQHDYVVKIMKCILPREACKAETEEVKHLYDRLDALGKYIEVAECMQHYGARVAIKTFVDCGEDRECLEFLLKKLSLSAVKRSPPLSETEWRSFLDDVLRFQKNVFKSVDPSDCIKIVVRALLCSGNRELIASSAKLMTCGSGAGLASSRPTFPAKLSYETSLELVLSAAREYVDSASSHSDPSIMLARACLRILDGKTPEVQAELDFLSALPLLSQFRVGTLPVQVRHCDKMGLIREALQQTPDAYKQMSKLLKLAEFLHVFGDDTRRREGAVLSLLAEAAFRDEDYAHCHEICGQLMAGRHVEGWKICQSLGQCSGFADLAARQKMLAFSLCYCPGPTVEGLLKARLLLELQEVYQRLDLPAEEWFRDSKESTPAPADNKGLPSSGSGDSVKSDNAQENPWGFVGYTAGTTRSVLTTLSSAEFWKGKVRNIAKISSKKSSHGLAVSSAASNHELRYLGVPAFYESLHKAGYIGKCNPSYEHYEPPERTPVLEDLFNVLRASTLAETLQETCTINCQETRSPVLLGLAKGLLYEDALLALACLFAVEQAEQIEELFLSLPSTPVVLGLAAYFFSLSVLVKLQPNNTHCLLKEDIPVIIQKASQADTGNVGGRILLCFKLATKFRKLQSDLAQAELLRKQGGSVDVERFTEDDRYKVETILGMALTLDRETLRVAISLAGRYDILAWDLYACHLEFLFSEGCGVSDIEDRLQADGMLETLLVKPEPFRDMLLNRIFPSLDGSDRSVMVFFYKLLEKCDASFTDTLGLTPAKHLILLEKLGLVCPGIDYKALLSESRSPLDILERFLEEENVHALAELAPSIPSKEAGPLSASSVYGLWASKLFLSKARVTTMRRAKWGSHFTDCKVFLDRLTPDHLLKFVDSACFSDAALQSVSRRIRLDVVKECLKMAKQNVEGGSEKRQQWSHTANELQKYLVHLQRIEDGALDEAIDPSDSTVLSYSTEFELSRGIPEKLEAMLLRCAMSEHRHGLLQSLLSCCPPGTVDKQPLDIYSDAIVLASEQLRNKSKNLHTVFEIATPEEVLERILHQALEESEEVFFADMALDLLRPFCLDTNVEIQVRLRVLEILEKNASLSAEDQNLLLVLRVQTIIWSEWPDYEVHETLVLDDDTRQSMFDDLVERCTTSSSCAILGKLLLCGDPLSSADDTNPGINPWCRLMVKLLDIDDSPGALDAAENLFFSAVENCSFNLECCRHVLVKFRERNSLIHFLRASFQTSHREVHMDAIKLLRTLNYVSEDDYDDRVLEQVLKLKLLPEAASTPLYSAIVEHLLANQDSGTEHLNLEAGVETLANAGKMAEAGTLLLQWRRMHPALCSFSVTLNAAKRWLERRGT